MICCKINTNFNDSNANLSKLFEDLVIYGDFLWKDNNLYFSNTDDYSIDEKKVKKILKSDGFKQFYIEIYGKNNQPTDEDLITYWILDKLVKINYNKYEKENQQMLAEVDKGLDLLNEEIDKIKKYKDAKLREEAENKNGQKQE